MEIAADHGRGFADLLRGYYESHRLIQDNERAAKTAAPFARWTMQRSEKEGWSPCQQDQNQRSSLRKKDRKA
jgi:hypothetical protein